MEKRILSSIVIVACILMLSSCKSRTPKNTDSGTLSGTINISGAFALYPLTVKWAEDFQKIHPEVKINISAGGAGKGMADVLSGMVDIAMFSRSVSPEEKQKGAFEVAVAKDAVIPTFNASNEIKDIILHQGISREELIKIFVKKEIKKWNELYHTQNKEAINIFTRSDACGAAQVWGEYLGVNQEDLQGVGVFGDPGIADAVKNDKLGIGYNNIAYAYDKETRTYNKGILVIPIDIDGNDTITREEFFYDSLDSLMNAISTNRYPSPPARDLYFITKGRSENSIVQAFLSWILNDGQQVVGEAGYVNLSDEKIQHELNRIISE